uniref:Large ribosomal subunit protein uL29m n=1 Tax=Nicotiana tabacum TaxID=4097 RepID=A0A1S4CRV9_TOBAC|nr:PREDICTED: 54S ribosomal protein L4, mitochondrial-like [Nicotiana tabacum]
MLAARLFGRTLLAAAKSESSAAAATSAATTKVTNPLEQFFEVDRMTHDDKPVVYGRSWKASELRLKSWDDLQKLWYSLSSTVYTITTSLLAADCIHCKHLGEEFNKVFEDRTDVQEL